MSNEDDLLETLKTILTRETVKRSKQFKTPSDGLHKMHWKVALNFAFIKRSELKMSLSAAIYAANYAGLNDFLTLSHHCILLVFPMRMTSLQATLPKGCEALLLASRYWLRDIKKILFVHFRNCWFVIHSLIVSSNMTDQRNTFLQLSETR